MGVSHRGIRKGDLGDSRRQRGIRLHYKQGQAIDKGDTCLGCAGCLNHHRGIPVGVNRQGLGKVGEGGP